MRATVIGCVEDKDIARLHTLAAFADDGLNALAHGAEMDRYVRRVGDQLAIGVEYRAGEIEPFLDIHRIGRVLQHDTHLFGDRHEKIVEHFQHDGIRLGADGMLRLAFLDPVDHHVIANRDFRLPAGFDHGGSVGIDNHRRPVDRLARRQRIPVVHGCALAGAGGIHIGMPQRLRRLGIRVEGQFFVRNVLSAADDLHRDRLDDVAFFRCNETELLHMRIFEGFQHVCAGAEIDDQRRIGSLVA